jgi:hypothetical protein
LEKSKSFALIDIMVVDKVAQQSSDAAKIRFMGTDPPISGKRAGVPVLIFVPIFYGAHMQEHSRLQLDITGESDLTP